MIFKALMISALCTMTMAFPIPPLESTNAQLKSINDLTKSVSEDLLEKVPTILLISDNDRADVNRNEQFTANPEVSDEKMLTPTQMAAMTINENAQSSLSSAEVQSPIPRLLEEADDYNGLEIKNKLGTRILPSPWSFTGGRG